MVDKDEQSKYSYPLELIDKMVEKMLSGITPMMEPELEIEVKLRFNEIRRGVGEEDGIDENDGLTIDELKQHEARLKKVLEDKRRKSSKDDVLIIKLSDEQKAKIREEMSSSYVRTDPNSIYNKTDDELYASAEEQEIMRRLKNIKACYYRVEDYMNAMKIIKEAVDYALEHEWPLLSKQEAVRKFNNGEIKLKAIQPPKLCLDNRCIITDPATLKGIISGDVVVKHKDDDEFFQYHKHDANDEGTSEPYHIISNTSVAEMTQLHKMGYNTDISSIINKKSSIYNRFIQPVSTKYSNLVDEDGTVKEFDWSQPNAAAVYDEMIHGRKNVIENIINTINKANNNNISRSLDSSLFNRFAHQMMHPNTPQFKNYMELSNAMVPDQKVVAMENQLLQNMRMNNPNI